MRVCVISIYTSACYLLCDIYIYICMLLAAVFLLLNVCQRKQAREKERCVYCQYLICGDWSSLSSVRVCVCDIHIYIYMLLAVSFCWYRSMCVRESERERERWVYCQYLISRDLVFSLHCACMYVWGDIYIYIYMQTYTCNLLYRFICTAECVWEKARERERGEYIVNTWFVMIGLLSPLCMYVCKVISMYTYTCDLVYRFVCISHVCVRERCVYGHNWFVMIGFLSLVCGGVWCEITSSILCVCLVVVFFSVRSILV